MFRKVFRLGIMLVMSFGLALVVACGKEKKRTEVQRRGNAQNKAGQATVEKCQKEKKILSLGGDKCIAPADCKSADNLTEKNGKCECKDGFSPDEKASACVPSTTANDSGEKTESQAPQNNQPLPPKPQPSSEEAPTGAGADGSLAVLKSGQGILNIQCSSQAHIDSLNIVVAGDNGTDLTLSYIMDKDVWFDEKTSKPLMAAANAPAEAKLAKIEAICMKACAAVKFSVQPATPGMASAAALSGVFYGIPQKSCGEDPSANGRPMDVSKDKPEIL